MAKKAAAKKVEEKKVEESPETPPATAEQLERVRAVLSSFRSKGRYAVKVGELNQEIGETATVHRALAQLSKSGEVDLVADARPEKGQETFYEPDVGYVSTVKLKAGK